MTHRRQIILAALLSLLSGLSFAQSEGDMEALYADFVGRYFDYYEAQQPDSAELMLRQALELMPEAESNFLLRANLAELVVSRGDTLEAIDLLSQALTSQPTIAEMRERRADLLAASGDVRTAVADYDELISNFPNNEVYRYKRVLQYERQELWEAAERDLTYIISRNDDAYLPRVKLAEIYAHQGRDLEAEKLLSYLIEQQPAMAPAYRSRARLMMRQDRKSDALKDVREVIRRSGTNVDKEDYLLRGEIWMMYGEDKEATDDFGRAVTAGASPEEVDRAKREANSIIKAVR